MPDNRIYMMHAVWFKADGGEQAYRKYLKKWTPLIKQVGGRKLKSFAPEREIIGEFDANLIFFVEFPDWAAYKKLANSPQFHQIAYIREEALEKSLLIRCVRPEKSYPEIFSEN